MIFSKDMVIDALENLKLEKAAGHRGLSNEFFVLGRSNKLIDLLLILFNLILKHGHIPEGFNISVLIPIPKSKDISHTFDYMPISISTPMCKLLEILIKDSMSFLSDLSPNQFGYRQDTSCKSAYLVANETLDHHRARNSNCYSISLDAAKAFDKLWRDGLFYELIPRTSNGILRL